jgi:hypothetical protein
MALAFFPVAIVEVDKTGWLIGWLVRPSILAAALVAFLVTVAA